MLCFMLVMLVLLLGILLCMYIILVFFNDICMNAFIFSSIVGDHYMKICPRFMSVMLVLLL